MSGAAIASGGAPRELWYLTRGAGAVTLVGLTGTTALGVLGSLRFSTRGWPRFVLDALHRNLALVTVTLLALHVVTAVLDGFAPIGLLDAFIPFGGRYRPLYLGLGALALDLLLAVGITSLLRGRIGYRAWRAVHWAAYACWPLALVHALGTGSDARITWMLALALACVLVVLGALGWRLAASRALDGAPRLAAGGAVVAALVAVAAWGAQGPLASGWARRAGTPRSLLAAAVAAPRHAGTPAPAVPFSAALSGAVRRHTAPDGRSAVVELALTLSGARTGRLDVRLSGVPAAGGGISLTDGRVSLRSGRGYVGRVTALNGQALEAVVRSSGAPALRLRIDLAIDAASATVTGTVRATLARGAGA